MVRWWGLGSQGKSRCEWMPSFLWGTRLSKLDSNFSAVLWCELCGPCSTRWGQQSLLPFLAGQLIDSFLLFFKPGFLHALVNLLVSLWYLCGFSVCVCVCVCMHMYCTSSAWCNNILGECAGCKLLHNILFLQLGDIDSEGKQWHE